MDINKIAKLLSIKIPSENLLLHEPMKKYTTFKIGGPADLLVKPSSKEELAYVLSVCKHENIPFCIIGNGSNLLVDDEGFRGIVIQLYKNFSSITVKEGKLIAESGALLARIANIALEERLTGFEFAHGIPGTLGGAVAMNAGAYDGEMKNVIVSCEVMNYEGDIMTLTNEELQLGYRTSRIQKEELIVLSATIALGEGEADKILAKMRDFGERRRSKQPLDKPSAGSTFKRPEGYFAGKLIMDAGLTGYRIGGAMVSDKHCGFVVTNGEATCKDVIELIEYIQKTVKEKFNVLLEPEVKRIKSER